MKLSDKTRNIILIIASCILLLCVIWTFTRGTNSERARICKFLYEYGYNVYEEDLLLAYDNSSTTIRAAIDKPEDELQEALEASKASGFRSNIDELGSVTLILATDGNDTVYMYMLNGEFELCFVQCSDSSIKQLVQQ